MKRAAYLIEDLKNRELFLKFAGDEEIEAFEASAELPLDIPLVFYITDKKDTILRNLLENTPRVLISDIERSSTKYYALNKHLNYNSFRLLMDAIYHGGRLWNIVDGLCFDASLKECYVSNHIADIERFVCLITEDFIHFCSFAALEKIRVGFSEMLTNAIEHGNLNITGEEKHEATESGTFQKLLEERINDNGYKARRVKVRIDVSKERAIIEVEDEGKGFDVSKLPSPQDVEQLLKLHGRGIHITRAYFDEVVYNAKGNAVRLLKKFS